MLIDTHCHIDFDEFNNDRQTVLSNAQQQGVAHIIVPSISQQSWQHTISICTQYSQQCHLALGLHPVFIEQHQNSHLDELNRLVIQHRPIAIGEIGLDFYLKGLDKQKQLRYFEQQLIIANQHQLPVIIHNRKAHDQCIRLLQRHKSSGGIIHAFNGSLQHAEKYIAMGFLLGFGGMLTYQRSAKLQTLVKSIPTQSIVLETDAPNMTVEQFHGQRNSPEYLPYIVSKIAELIQLTEADVAHITSNNIYQLFPSIRNPTNAL